MADCNAVDTIKGYFYQFDYSICQLLRLAAQTDSIAVESIEDVDVHTACETTAIQCKYYAKTEYNHSVIKEAILYMVDHFKAVKDGTKPKIRYVLRGHYLSGHDKLSNGIDVEFLKLNFLTYTSQKVKYQRHVDLNLDDATLAEFLGQLTVDIHAEEFDQQFQSLIDQLKTEFNCSPFAAEFFFYNNALRVIKEITIQSDPAQRIITKKAFLDRINTSSILFNEWFIQKKGVRAHLAALRRKYFQNLNTSPFERFFLVEIDPANYVRADLKDLVFTISRKWSKTHKNEPKPICPYLFIQGIDASELLELKKELAREGPKFIDGYDYHGAEFNPASIQQRPTAATGIKIKILNSLSDLTKAVETITATRKIFQFHLGAPYWDFSHPSVSHVKIQLEKLSDLKEVI